MSNLRKLRRKISRERGDSVRLSLSPLLVEASQIYRLRNGLSLTRMSDADLMVEMKAIGVATSDSTSGSWRVHPDWQKRCSLYIEREGRML